MRPIFITAKRNGNFVITALFQPKTSIKGVEIDARPINYVKIAN